MNWDRIEGNWKQFKGTAKQQWGKLTDDQLDVIAGKRDHLVGRIQEAYGISKDVTEKQVSDWLDHQEETENFKTSMPANGPAPSVKRVVSPVDGSQLPVPKVDPKDRGADESETIHTIPSKPAAPATEQQK